MAPTSWAKRVSHSSEWSSVSTETNTVTPRPSLSWSITATRFWITPSASRRWIRFQHGVEDSPTRLPISATDSEASSCNTARIFRSMASMPQKPRAGNQGFGHRPTYRLLFFLGSQCHGLGEYYFMPRLDRMDRSLYAEGGGRGKQPFARGPWPPLPSLAAAAIGGLLMGWGARLC